MLTLSLQEAVQYITGHEGIKIIDLSHQLGFQDGASVTRYKSGKTKACSATRAKIIFDTYDILLDVYASTKDLEFVVNKELTNSVKVRSECEHIMDKLIVIASYQGKDLRQKLLRLIADLDTRE